MMQLPHALLGAMLDVPDLRALAQLVVTVSVLAEVNGEVAQSQNCEQSR